MPPFESPDASPWWDRQVHAERRPFLLARARIKSAVRAWFEARGFIEVDTACLQVSPGNEAHLSAFRTELIGTDLGRSPLYLRTSPEFACKKLLAAGEEKVFTFAPVFRNRERGPLHSPEFTLLEWYRAGAPYEEGMRDCIDIARIAAEIAGATEFQWSQRRCTVRSEPVQLTVAEAFRRHANIDLAASFGDRQALARDARRLGLGVSAGDSWSDLFSRILAGWVEPALGVGRPALLTEYPISEGALARAKPDDPRFAERFELYACGVELANGFGELTDAAEQRRRFEAAMATRRARYGDPYPIDEEFLAALAHMPPATGVALGFDRLLMLATGASRLEQVLWTPLSLPAE